MADTIQIIVKTGANPDGTGGTVTLQPVVVIPDGMANELMQSFDELLGPIMVDNPNFDPNQPEDPSTNPKQIKASAAVVFTTRMREYAEQTWANWRLAKARRQAEATERAAVQSVQSQVSVIQNST